MIGYFHDLIFETSDKKVITFQDKKTEANAIYEYHDCIGQKPQSEFLRPDLVTVSFQIMLHTKLGIDPKTEADKWLDYCRSGVVGTLCIGVPIGVEKWTIRSVSQQWNRILNNGKLIYCTVDVTLKEYITNMWLNR